MIWTDERIALLTKLWGEGLSASQIAAELGAGMSRSAVLGKVHRLGLVREGSEASPPRPRKPRAPDSAPTVELSSLNERAPASMPTTSVAPHEPPVPTPPREAAGVPSSEGVTIMELREAMCRFPLGDPTTPEFRFCGARANPGMPYCVHHAQIAYVPASERKRLRA